METISEKFKSKGIFQALSEQQSNVFSQMFQALDAHTLDLDFVSSYGNRIIPSTLIDMSIDDIAKIIWERFQHKWQMFDSLPDWQNPVNLTTTTESESGSNTTGSTTHNTNNDTYGFNDTTSVPKDDSTDKTTNSNNVANNGNTTVTQKGRNNDNALSDYRSYVNMIASRMTSIFSDILSIVSIPIYGKDNL